MLKGHMCKDTGCKQEHNARPYGQTLRHWEYGEYRDHTRRSWRLLQTGTRTTGTLRISGLLEVFWEYRTLGVLVSLGSFSVSQGHKETFEGTLVNFSSRDILCSKTLGDTMHLLGKTK